MGVYQVLGLQAEDWTQEGGGEPDAVSGQRWSAGLFPATLLPGRGCDMLERA